MVGKEESGFFIKDNPTYVEDVTPYMKASAQNEKKN